MSEDKNFKDVNRNDYIRSMLVELVGQKAMTDFAGHKAKQAKLIYDLVMENPTNKGVPEKGHIKMEEVKGVLDKTVTFDSRGLPRDKEGFILIDKANLSKDFRKKAAKLLANRDH